MTKILSFCILISALQFTYGQSGPNTDEPNNPKPFSLSLKVADTFTSQALEFVQVEITDLDKQRLQIALTDSNGFIAFQKLQKRELMIRLKYFGYKEKWIGPLDLSEASDQRFLGTVALSPLVNDLDEVKVVGQKSILKTSIDKRVYEVGNDLNNQGSNASEVLNNVPSIDVDQDGNIALRGEGNVIILINGRPSALTGSVENLLEALPADAVERVEVVTNPSAKYDPDGTAGIINIVLKKNKLRGMNGRVSTTVANGPLANGSANISLKNKRLNVYANYAANYRDGAADYFGNIEQGIGTDNYTNLEQVRLGNRQRFNQNARFGIDYDLSANQTIGASVNQSWNDGSRVNSLNNRLFSDDSLVANWYRVADDRSKGQSTDFGVNYQWKFKEDMGELQANASYSMGAGNRDGFYDEYTYEDENPLDQTPYLSQYLSNNDVNEIWTSQLDYSRVLLSWNAKIEAGVKNIQRSELQNVASFTADSNGVMQPDTFSTFDYRYDERVTSSYLTFGQALGKWRYQIGLRGELAEQVPFLLSENQRLPSTYNNLFPSGHLRYSPEENRTIGFSYSRRISRPSSRRLNPFTNYSDPLNLRRGNPYLNPEFVNSYELSFDQTRKWGGISASIFYRQTTDVIQRVKIFEEKVAVGTYANIDEKHVLGSEFIYSFRIKRNLRGNISYLGDYQRYDVTDTVNFSNAFGFNHGVKAMVNYSFWKNTANVQMNVNVNSKRITPQGVVLPRGALDISGKKTLNKHWEMGLRVSDIFNTRGFYYEVETGRNAQRAEYKWLTRRFYFTLTYTFGSYEMTDRRGGGGMGDGGGFEF